MVDRQVRLFCQLLAAEAQAKGKPLGWWMSLSAIADRLGVPYDRVERLATRCADLQLVTWRPPGMTWCAIASIGRNQRASGGRRPSA